MAVYIARRLVAAFFILVGASFIVYMLMTQAGDPLAFTLAITNPTQRAAVINTVTETLSLDQPPVQRYFDWLRRLLFEGDFGLVSTTQQPVWDELKLRVPLTLKLVTAATVMSVDRRRLRRHRHGVASVLGVRLPRHVLHVRVLLPAGLLGRRHPQVVGRHQLQRLAA